MKIMKKAAALLVVILLLCAVTPAALAVSDTSAEAGKTATLTFKFNDVYNVDGTFKVKDTDGIVSKYTISVAKAGATSAVVNGDRLWAAPAAEPVKTDVSVTVKVTLKSDAAVGKKCTVSFTGVYGDGNGKPGNEKDVYQAATVSVKKADPKPVPTVDYTELQKQIAIAEGLTSTGYTTSSWNAMIAALDAGKAALTSTSQDTVDAAAKALADAIAALVKMDYSKLHAAIKSVEDFTGSEELADLFNQLFGAVNEGKGLLTSGDQAEVDAAAARINELLEKIKEALDALKNKEPETVIKEVEVEVLPKDDYCNIDMHRVWPILFFISLGLNAILVAVIGMAAAKKKKNAKDDTPLVDYDIGDDA